MMRKIDFEIADAISKDNESRMPNIADSGKVNKLLGFFYMPVDEWRKWNTLWGSLDRINLPEILKQFFAGGTYNTLEKRDTHGFTYAEGCFGPKPDVITGCYFSGYDADYSLKSKDKKLEGDMHAHIGPSAQTMHSINIDDLHGNVYGLGYGRLSHKENGVIKREAYKEALDMTGKVWLSDETNAIINYIKQKSKLKQ